jgi:antitoxin (DNA-binding transcriptional repressor) of toxin-antitoxin stability system
MEKCPLHLKPRPTDRSHPVLGSQINLDSTTHQIQIQLAKVKIDTLHTLCVFLYVRATLSQLHRETRRIVRPVIHGGEEVVITDFGNPVARIVPYMPTVTVSPSQARERGTLDDDSILAAIIEAREDELERLVTL